MRTKISKSSVMSRAWSIYKGNNPYSYSFSAALTRAWEVEKAYAKRTEEKATEIVLPKTSSYLPMSESFHAGAAAYYRENRSYYGD